jgi:hypothetical protein
MSREQFLNPNLAEQLPPAGENNVWFHCGNGDTAFIFVHGIFSDSRSCWLHSGQGNDPDIYWPELIRTDPRLGPASIFLAGYYTAVDAADYDLGNCAHEVFSALQRTDIEGHSAPLSRDRLVFVCHSTGGIVVRYLLDRHYSTFRQKEVGLVLIASPSYGSVLANRLSGLARFYRQALGLQLEWGGTNLKDLDERFKDLLDEKRIPKLVGVEAYENHFILHRKWLPDIPRVVTELSAGRYFGSPVLLRKTNHFSAVKPSGLRHPAHELIVDFWQRHFARKGSESLESTNEQSSKPVRVEYFCYISRDKLDQLFTLHPDVQVQQECIPEIRAVIDSVAGYGRSDILQRNAEKKREYVRQLKETLRRCAGQIQPFVGMQSTELATGLYWYRGEFFVDDLDTEQLMARLVSHTDQGKLILYCSLGNFSDEPVRNGSPFLHSTNYAFFRDKLKIMFECAFYLLSASEGTFTGSPLFLKLASASGVVL